METKNDHIIIRLTTKEKGRAIRKAKKAKQSLSEFLRTYINQ